MIGAVKAFADAVRADGWQNAILGLGGPKDPSAYTSFRARPRLSDNVLEALYVEDHFAGTIVEALVHHALRPGWDLEVPGDPEHAAAIRLAYATREEELGVAAELAQGWCWGRVFGGAVTWIGADDGRPAHVELDEDSIASVRFLHTFDRRDVQVWSYYTDPQHPRFRRPRTYMIRPIVSLAAGNVGGLPQVAGGVEVHESRCVVWGGQTTTDRRRQELQGWDDSIIERCWEPLKQLSEDFAAKSLLLGRISQAVYRIKNLYQMIAGKQEEVLRRRLGLMEMSRSRARAIVLDTDESYEQHSQSLSGLPEAIQISALRLASAAEMPVSILMGQNQQGSGESGETDLKIWDSTVSSNRELVLRPRHERITRLILLSKDGPTSGEEPDDWRISYRPLREQTRAELAKIGKIEMETDALAIEKGIYSADHAALRHGPGGGRPQLDEREIRERLERRRQLANQPPKDNAELGTIAPRTSAVLEVIQAVRSGAITRESGHAVLTAIHRHTPEDAEALLGPPDAPPPPPDASPRTPGPDPEPQYGQAAGAPQAFGGGQSDPTRVGASDPTRG